MEAVGEIWMLMLGGQEGEVELCPLASNYCNISVHQSCPIMCGHFQQCILASHAI